MGTSKLHLIGILGGDFTIVAGGKGANQAVAAARAGSDVTFVAKVGEDDFGRQAIAGYKKEAINTEYIFIDKSHPTGVAIIVVDENNGQNSIVVAPGSNAYLTVSELEEITSVITDADLILIQLEIPLAVVEFVVDLAHKSGIRTILNPAPALDITTELLQKVDIITPNETEAAILSNLKVSTTTEIKACASSLIKHVKQAVIITLGEKGVYVQTKEKEGQFIPTIKVDAIDTTAAGDVFNGYLAAFLAQGKKIDEAIETANLAAAKSVRIKGAQPSIPLLKEINL